MNICFIVISCFIGFVIGFALGKHHIEWIMQLIRMGDITKFDDAEVIEMEKELCIKKVVINISEEDYDKITFKNVNSNAFRDTV